MQPNRIREIRRRKDMNQRELARLAGTSQQQIARLERGEQKITLQLAVAIAAALHTPLGRVFPWIRDITLSVGGEDA